MMNRSWKKCWVHIDVTTTRKTKFSLLDLLEPVQDYHHQRLLQHHRDHALHPQVNVRLVCQILLQYQTQQQQRQKLQTVLEVITVLKVIIRRINIPQCISLLPRQKDFLEEILMRFEKTNILFSLCVYFFGVYDNHLVVITIHLFLHVFCLLKYPAKNQLLI